MRGRGEGGDNLDYGGERGEDRGLVNASMFWGFVWLVGISKGGYGRNRRETRRGLDVYYRSQ